jgi:hypothetical protein
MNASGAKASDICKFCRDAEKQVGIVFEIGAIVFKIMWGPMRGPCGPRAQRGPRGTPPMGPIWAHMANGASMGVLMVGPYGAAYGGPMMPTAPIWGRL